MTKKSLNGRRVLVGILIAFCVLVLVEVLALAWLYFSVGKYRTFWQNKIQESGELTYLALGDSAAQGIGASSPMRGYVGLIAKQLEAQTGKKVRVVNLSVTGAKMEDYLHDQAPQIKNYQPDIVTIEIGANDIGKYDEQKFRDEFLQVIETLPIGSFVANMPLFNSRPASKNPAMQASKVIEEELKQNGQMKFVDLQKYTTENQSIFGFAPDLFHPNNLSYKNWANAFYHQIQKDL